VTDEDRAIFARELTTLTRRLMSRDAGEPGRVVLFLGAARGAGCSTMARAVALIASTMAARGVWLIDLDFWRNRQHELFAAQAPRLGELGPAKDGAIQGQTFWRVTPDDSAQPRRLLHLHQIGDKALFVSRFRSDLLGPDEKLQVAPSPAYWDKARTMADLVVIDAPSLAASRAALAVGGQADASILVLAPDVGDAADAYAAKDEIEARGGRAAGFIFNRAHPGASRTQRVA
jgi:Mrp family chromosome partitioning ATPase